MIMSLVFIFDFKAAIRINPKQYEDSFVPHPVRLYSDLVTTTLKLNR